MSTKNLAYLDPGSASIAIQMLIGVAAAAAVSVKVYWRRLLRFLHLRKPPQPTPPADPR